MLGPILPARFGRRQDMEKIQLLETLILVSIFPWVLLMHVLRQTILRKKKL